MRCNKAELQVSNTPPPTLWKPSIHAGSAHITCRKTVRMCSTWRLIHFRFLAHSLANARSLGLRRAVPPLACYRWFRCCSFGDESPDSSSNALRSSQTHETGLNTPQGMGGMKNAYRGFLFIRIMILWRPRKFSCLVTTWIFHSEGGLI